jgi:dihydrofolate reductase
MGKIIVSEFMTLDGVMEDPGAWNIPYMNKEADEYKTAEILEMDALLLGGTTYTEFAAAWPSIDIGPFSDKINSMPKYVVSANLKESDLIWGETTQIKTNVVAEIKKLKEQPGTLFVNGGAELVKTLVENNLIDEYRVQLHPVLWGKGKKLFKDGFDHIFLTLKECKALSNGLILLTFTPSEAVSVAE